MATGLRILLQRCAKRFIEAIKMVKLHSASMFLKDPVDVWGNEVVIGNAELAARLGSPMMFDRRGDILYHDDFESPTLKCYPRAYGNATSNRSNSYSRSGDFSLKCTTDAIVGSGDYAGLMYSHNDFHIGNVGTQISFMCADVANDYKIMNFLYWYDGSNVYRALIYWYNATGKLWYNNSLGVMTELAGTYKYKYSERNFAAIKLVVDMEKKEYVRVLLFGSEIDMSGIAIENDGATSDRYLYTSFTIGNESAVSSTMYFDNYILTENEPL